MTNTAPLNPSFEVNNSLKNWELHIQQITEKIEIYFCLDNYVDMFWTFPFKKIKSDCINLLSKFAFHSKSSNIVYDIYNNELLATRKRVI